MLLVPPPAPLPATSCPLPPPAGLMHLKGWGTKPDAAKAIQLFVAAAKSGNMLAAYNLAMLHLGGHTAERAPCQAAVALLKKVAEKGFPAQQVRRLCGGGGGF